MGTISGQFPSELGDLSLKLVNLKENRLKRRASQIPSLPSEYFSIDNRF
jgi:hypothetical protein